MQLSRGERQCARRELAGRPEQLSSDGRGDALREYESSPGKSRAFCSVCGSPIFAYLVSSPDVLRLRLGSLDTAFTKRAKAHTIVGDKAAWESIDDELPQFEEWAPVAVLHQRGSRQGDI